MAETLNPILLGGGGITITEAGGYQISNPTPNFLYDEIITIDPSLMEKGDVVNIYLPLSSEFFYGTSGKINIQTTTDLTDISVNLYLSEAPRGVTPDRLNGRIGGSVTDIGVDGLWVIAQLLAPTRWNVLSI